MSDLFPTRTLLAMAALALVSVPARAEAPPAGGALTPAAAVQRALEHSPTLRAAVLDAKRAAVDLDGEQSRYLPALTAKLDYSHTGRPNLNTSGVTVSDSDAVTGTLGVAQQFAWGTSVAAQLSLSGTVSGYFQPGFTEALTLGPGYGLNLNLSVNQPLLRGNGRLQWEAAERQAEIARDAARTAEEEAASSEVQAVLTAYWNLWYAQEAVRIQEQALATTRRQLADTDARVTAGARAKFDLLPLRTQVASLEEALVTARSTMATRRVALARLLGEPLGATGLAAAASAPPELVSAPDASAVVTTAQARAYALADLRANIEQARVSAAVAAENARVKLDAGAWVTVAGLGNERVDDALEQFGTFAAVSGGVSLALELPTDRTLVESEAATARLTVESARARLQAAEEQLAQQATELVESVTAAQARATFAKETAALAAETVAGQRDRFQSGVGTATELILAEQEQREAELRIAKARIDVETARLALAHLTGSLLAEAGVTR